MNGFWIISISALSAAISAAGVVVSVNRARKRSLNELLDAYLGAVRRSDDPEYLERLARELGELKGNARVLKDSRTAAEALEAYALAKADYLERLVRDWSDLKDHSP